MSKATKPYVVTEKAGDWVAGKRVKHGDVLVLTDAQAKYECLIGTIREAGSSAVAAAEAGKGKGRRK